MNEVGGCTKLSCSGGDVGDLNGVKTKGFNGQDACVPITVYPKVSASDKKVNPEVSGLHS